MHRNSPKEIAGSQNQALPCSRPQAACHPPPINANCWDADTSEFIQHAAFPGRMLTVTQHGRIYTPDRLLQYTVSGRRNSNTALPPARKGCEFDHFGLSPTFT